MNNLNKIVAVVVMLFAFVMTSSCKLSVEKSQVQEKLHIECETLPEKTAYHVIEDDELDIEGLMILAEYSDGTTKDVTAACSFEGFDSSVVTENQVITVCYEEDEKLYTTEFCISVYTELTSIEVERESEENFVISRGDELDLSEIKVLAKYDDGTKKYVHDWELAGFKNKLIGLNQEVAVEYTENGKTCQDSIFVDVLYKFSDEPEYLPEGTDGSIGTEGHYVKFGDYPQSLKEENVEIFEERSIQVGVNTYYLGSDGNYYASVEKNDVTNYYRVKPMEWRILSKNYTGTTDEGDNISGKLLLAENIYISGKFAEATGTNNYRESLIRQYLNNDFLETAFTTSARELMIKPELYNNINSAGPFTVLEREASSIPIEEDKVFILSMADVSNAAYGFGTPEVHGGRMRSPTEYIKDVGVQINTLGTAWWWLRTPNGVSDKYKLPATYGVNSNGTLDNLQHPISNGSNRPGIVPAIVLK